METQRESRRHLRASLPDGASLSSEDSTLSPEHLTRWIKDQARKLGFELVGVTSPDPPPSYHRYLAWIAHGYYAQMYYMVTDRALRCRRDPRELLPECKSILVLGLKYWSPDALEPPSDHRPRGRVSSYAWGADYHDILNKRLRRLVQAIETKVGHPVPHRYYTDTGPILERDMAWRAGLGWIGKHACLIHPRKGSYYFLAEILLGIELMPDAPFPAEHCGRCTRCIDACPTQCILPDRTVDANRCISYLTIEHKGSIPEELRPLMGSWIFGCDICQMVCPWNQRFAAKEGDPELAPRPDVPFPDLIAEITLTEEDFRRKFKGSPVRRAKRRGYLRNVAVALGNMKDPRAVSALRSALADPDPLVREHVAWALREIGTDAARAALEEALKVETHLGLRALYRRYLRDWPQQRRNHPYAPHEPVTSQDNRSPANAGELGLRSQVHRR